MWLYRSMALYMGDSKEFRQEKVQAREDKEEFTRFTPLDRFLHALVISSFLLLVITGMPLKFFYTDWAKAILSVMGSTGFARAVLDNDVTAFTRVGGVGKKTGQRIILEMKAKLGQDAELNAILGEPETAQTPESDDVIAALCSLGCTLSEARKAASLGRKELGDDASDEDLVRIALRSLAKG